MHPPTLLDEVLDILKIWFGVQAKQKLKWMDTERDELIW
jgi:hypothetical protein